MVKLKINARINFILRVNIIARTFTLKRLM